jgi:hypothetical protein
VTGAQRQHDRISGLGTGRRQGEIDASPVGNPSADRDRPGDIHTAQIRQRQRVVGDVTDTDCV